MSVYSLAPTSTSLSTDLLSTSNLSDKLINVSTSVFNLFVTRPLATLYLEGPAALGFWGGVPLADVCAQLTNTNADFWQSTDATVRACEENVERHFNSWMVLTTTAAYFCASAGLLRAVLCRRRAAPAQVIYLQNGATPSPSGEK